MKKLFKIVLIFLTPLYIFAHELVVNLYDNKDGTMQIEGKFNTGESAAGILVKINTIHSNETIFQQRLTEDKLVVDIPKIAYKVILVDEEDGDFIEKIGIEPPQGFEKVDLKDTKQEKKQETPNRMGMKLSSSMAVNVTIILGFILLFATILISIRNTNKILKEIQK
ncbi:putative membrane protein [Aliarcobacter faecis]|uniref:hypothetical protein n=1 Tax=Aliarcobacter faecis TaxID=1564138 RepID=UPI00047EEF87|nr:hypothetical protein [Aliarcobacter faecis]QKF72505.1 putative membrane protein [Aliarcobacter faecis]